MRRSPGSSRPDPRTYCGEQFPWPLIVDLSDGDDVVACYVVRDRRRAETRTNKPYLRLTLGDSTGTITGYVWEEADRWEPRCAPDEVVGVRGRVGSYQDQLQLKIQEIEPLSAGAADLERLLPASPRPRAQMERELDRLIESVQDPSLRTLLLRCVGRGSDLGSAFRIHPAAKRNHHAYLCGLLEHSLSVATISDLLCEHYRSQGTELDRDLLVAGALLHDLGKVRELRGFPNPGYTTEGQLLGHIVMGIQLVAQEAGAIPDISADRLLLLQHLIASHQGKPEWDSPKVPQMREALLLHYADDLDAKMNQASQLLAGVGAGEWSDYDRSLGRAFFQPPAFPVAAEVEPVPPEEAVDLIMDLFRG